MARRPELGRCVHCLVEPDDLTWDHIPPRSWYPGSTPSGLARWKVPACRACNGRYGQIEERLLLRLGLCTDPRDALASGISERALRSLRPECATSERDRRAREKARREILAEIREFASVPESGVLPYFGRPSYPEYGPYHLVFISGADLRAFGEKLVRGITYLDSGAFIGRSYEVGVHIIDERAVPEVEGLLQSHGEFAHRGPGFVVVRAKAMDDPICAMFRIVIWGRLRLHAVVCKPEAIPDVALMAPTSSRA